MNRKHLRYRGRLDQQTLIDFATQRSGHNGGSEMMTFNTRRLSASVVATYTAQQGISYSPQLMTVGYSSAPLLLQTRLPLQRSESLLSIVALASALSST